MRKISKILSVLRKYYKKREGSANLGTPFHVLISCVLSQRTREENTEKAAKQLFSKANNPEEIAKLPLKKLQSIIKPAGFYREKAKRIKEICRVLLQKYNGRVPETRKELLALPGVGWKTSAVVLCYGFGKPIIAVDVHTERIPKRLGLVETDANVEEVRRKLERIFPKRFWRIINLGFVNFGREVCRPIRPRCGICKIKDICKYYKKRFL